MKKLFSILGFLTLTSVPFMSPLQVSTNSEIVTNEIDNNYQLVELEKQKKPISDFSQYNNELYIAMFQGHLAKMNSEGKITQIPLVDSSARDKGYMYMKEFNRSLYLTNSTQLLQMTPKGKINKILDFPKFSMLAFLEVFNNELYTAFSSVDNYNSLIKIDTKGIISKVLNFESGVFPSAMKSFNSHLYFAAGSECGSTLTKVDVKGEIKQTTIFNFQIEHLVEFNSYLYLFIDDGSIYSINHDDQLKKIKGKDSSFDPTAFVIFRDELYLGSNKLEKLTKDNKVKVVKNLKIRSNIESLVVFNDELYLGMFGGHFAKLNLS